MERGVVIGGILISASFLLAVLLNHSADNPTQPASSAVSPSTLQVGAEPRLAEPAADGAPDDAATHPVQPAMRDNPGCCVPGSIDCPAKARTRPR